MTSLQPPNPMMDDKASSDRQNEKHNAKTTFTKKLSTSAPTSILDLPREIRLQIRKLVIARAPTDFLSYAGVIYWVKTVKKSIINFVTVYYHTIQLNYLPTILLDDLDHVREGLVAGIEKDIITVQSTTMARYDKDVDTTTRRLYGSYRGEMTSSHNTEVRFRQMMEICNEKTPGERFWGFTSLRAVLDHGGRPFNGCPMIVVEQNGLRVLGYSGFFEQDEEPSLESFRRKAALQK